VINISKKTNKNATTVVNSNKTVERGDINYNTYLILTPLFKALIVSTNNNGKYNLKKGDEAMGFYFNYSELNLNIKVPLTALFNVNEKTRGILGIKWASALECPSRRRGYCQLGKEGKNCYAINGERQGSKKSYNYLMGMGSYLNSLLCVNYWALFNKDPVTRSTFFRYCQYYAVDTLRFNLSGDFKNRDDLKNLEYLAENGLKLTGYTARDDLRADLLDIINKHDNIILNGSNIMYSNQFKATKNILHYLTAKNRCRGGCLVNGCLNCYKLKGELIIVLIHGSGVGVDLNTPFNRAFIQWAFNIGNIDINIKDLRPSADLYRFISNSFKSINFKGVPDMFLTINKKGDLKFNGHSAIINYIEYIIKSNGFKAVDFLSIYNNGGDLSDK